MECHHIDYNGLQIHIDVRNGRDKPIFTCILCDTVFDLEQYGKVIKSINERVKNHTLTPYRTPNGKTHTEEDCVDKRKCDIHEEDEK